MKSKIYLIFALLFSVFTAELFAATSVEHYLDDDDEAVVYVSNGISYTRILTEIDGDGSSESSAIKAYAPVDDGASSSSNINGGNILTSTGNVRFDLDISNSEADPLYLTLAYQKDGEWFIGDNLDPTYTLPSGSSVDQRSFRVPGSLFWNVVTDLSGTVDNYYIYIFLTSTFLAPSNTTVIDESSLPDGGLYYRLYLSARTYTAPPYDAPTFHYLIKGDGRLFLDYTGALMADGLKSVIVSYDNNRAFVGKVDVSTATAGPNFGTILSTEYDACSGNRTQITVSDLSNSSPYNFAVACVDKFNFATEFSTSKDESPESIEAFLEKNACYFISAGFGEEHYVLAYFRDFRDEVLLKTSWGERFVGWYYRSAPKYANIVYLNSSLSFIVRIASYCLYFILNFWKLIFAFSALIIGAVIFVLTRRNVNA